MKVKAIFHSTDFWLLTHQVPIPEPALPSWVVQLRTLDLEIKAVDSVGLENIGNVQVWELWVEGPKLRWVNELGELCTDREVREQDGLSATEGKFTAGRSA